jgi:D-3-phosphoglycerate dehydrogenase
MTSIPAPGGVPGPGGTRLPVLITDPVVPECLALLGAAPGIEVRYRPGLTGEDLLREIADCAALIVRSGTQVTRPVIEAGALLQVIARAGTGIDNVDVDAATARGILVVNAPSGNTIAATEHTLALMLALARRIPAADRSLKTGEWQRSRFLGVELRGKTLGIIGYGRVGREVARRAAAFDMRIVVHDPFVAARDVDLPGVELLPLGEVLAAADFLTLHLPLTATTRHVVKDATFAQVKPGVRLVNVSRGGVVDEAALLRALDAGQVAGAAIDVFAEEPPPANHPFFNRDDVIVTPHLGASTREAQELVALTVAEQVLAVLAGKPALNAVNLPSLPPELMERAGPFLHLAERLGAMQAQLAAGPPTAVHARFAGEVAALPTEVIALGLYKGLLTPSLGDRVNFVNCRAVLKERRVAVEHTCSDEAGEFTSLIEVTVESAGARHVVGGTVRRDGSYRLVAVDGYAIDATPAGAMIVLKNRDVPGVVGRIGTILGGHAVNIATMTWGRRGGRGEDALTVINIDSPLPSAAAAELAREPTVHWVRAVELPPAIRPAG